MPSVTVTTDASRSLSPSSSNVLRIEGQLASTISRTRATAFDNNTHVRKKSATLCRPVHSSWIPTFQAAIATATNSARAISRCIPDLSTEVPPTHRSATAQHAGVHLHVQDASARSTDNLSESLKNLR